MPRKSETLALYMAHRGDLVNYASKIVGDRAHAEDVVQEAYLRFDAAVDERRPGEPLAYLYRIVRNLSLDVRRHVARDRARQMPDGEATAREVGADDPSPEAEAGAREQLQAMMAAMAELPERTRIALEMHRFGGCTFKTIAEHLGISVGLAHALVIDGLEHCRERLFRKS